MQQLMVMKQNFILGQAQKKAEVGLAEVMGLPRRDCIKCGESYLAGDMQLH